MTQNNITDIEKCARLMGREIFWCPTWCAGEGCWMVNVVPAPKDEKLSKHVPFNPYVSKSDLIDLENSIGIDIRHADDFVIAKKIAITEYGFIKQHPDKFAARAEAVIAVAVQIYDAKYGKDGE